MPALSSDSRRCLQQRVDNLFLPAGLSFSAVISLRCPVCCLLLLLLLQFTMLRDLDGQQFSDAVSDKLGPRMQLTGDTASLETFKTFFEGQKLVKGMQVGSAAVICSWQMLLWAGQVQHRL
jgi:hypothetical protein